MACTSAGLMPSVGAGGDQQRVAVRARLGHEFRPISVPAPVVVDDPPAASVQRRPFADLRAREIGQRARRIGHDQPDRPMG